MGDPERFDIVICDYPNTDDGMYRVKRVIGLPGETIELKKGELYVNGEHVEQQFDMTPNETDFGPFTVPEGHYFVMGDNRNNSKDSRSPMVGPLERKMIKGHVRCVVFPLSKARILGEVNFKRRRNGACRKLTASTFQRKNSTVMIASRRCSAKGDRTALCVGKAIGAKPRITRDKSHVG